MANYGRRTLSQASLLGRVYNIQLSHDFVKDHEGNQSDSISEDNFVRPVTDDSSSSGTSPLTTLTAVSTSDWMALLESRRQFIHHLQLKLGKK